jgi:hypothetical protein
MLKFVFFKPDKSDTKPIGDMHKLTESHKEISKMLTQVGKLTFEDKRDCKIVVSKGRVACFSSCLNTECLHKCRIDFSLAACADPSIPAEFRFTKHCSNKIGKERLHCVQSLTTNHDGHLALI